MSIEFEFVALQIVGLLVIANCYCNTFVGC